MTSESQRYRVDGMSCSHCVAAVRHEVEQVAGVEAVDVDLGAGVVTVLGEGVEPQAVRAAIDEAGYQVVA